MDFGVVMAGEAEEAALAGLLRGFESFDGAAGTEDAVHIRLLLNAVHLPEIDVIGLQGLEGNVELVFGVFPDSFGALGGEEDILADVGEDIAVHLFGMSVPVRVGAIEVIQAEVVGVADVGAGGFLVTEQRQASAALADHG